MTAYYNEIDPFAAAWLRELIRCGHIAPGDVDERSIADVRATDLVGYQQVHFFAGIGGWSLALRLAGIPDDAEVWTGSCPCQPFSVAGKGRGTADERHLWPAMRDLVAERGPAVCLGEQVASLAGRSWLSAVRSDLEALGYAVGAADLCAAGVGAPHIRQRLYWGGVRVADSGCVSVRGQGSGPASGEEGGVQGPAGQRQRVRADFGAGGSVAGGLVDPNDAGPQGRGVSGDGAGQRPARPAGLDAWRDHGWVECADGRSRPVAPISRRVDDGVLERLGLLRGFGNAIVPQVAAIFARAVIG